MSRHDRIGLCAFLIAVALMFGLLFVNIVFAGIAALCALLALAALKGQQL